MGVRRGWLRRHATGGATVRPPEDGRRGNEAEVTVPIPRQSWIWGGMDEPLRILELPHQPNRK